MSTITIKTEGFNFLMKSNSKGRTREQRNLIEMCVWPKGGFEAPKSCETTRPGEDRGECDVWGTRWEYTSWGSHSLKVCGKKLENESLLPTVTIRIPNESIHWNR